VNVVLYHRIYVQAKYVSPAEQTLSLIMTCCLKRRYWK